MSVLLVDKLKSLKNTDHTFQSLGLDVSGTVLQVVHKDLKTAMTINSKTPVDLISLDITPKQEGSSLLITNHVIYGQKESETVEICFFTKVDSAFEGVAESRGSGYYVDGAWHYWDASVGYGSGDSTKYWALEANRIMEVKNNKLGVKRTVKLQAATRGADSGFINRCSNNTKSGAGVSSLTVMEVAK